MLGILSDIALGTLTLWLLFKEGLNFISERTGTTDFRIKRIVKKADITIKILVIAVFCCGIVFKIAALRHNSEMQDKMFSKIEKIEEKTKKLP